jgi:hypothetical protein
MRRDPRAYLWDVREAADAIASFVLGRRKRPPLTPWVGPKDIYYRS